MTAGNSRAATSRAEVLGKIRKSLQRDAPLSETPSESGVNPVPARAQLPDAERLELFVRYAEASQASVTRIKGGENVPKAVADFLAGQNLAPKIRVAPELDQIPWEQAPLLEAEFGKADPEDAVGVTGAYCALAETGTIMMISGEDRPSTLTMLPETHVVVLRADQVVGGLQDGWSRLREDFGEGQMPRTAIFVTGPSRTGDIELTMFLGAHGPRRLHIILVEDD